MKDLCEELLDEVLMNIEDNDKTFKALSNTIFDNHVRGILAKLYDEVEEGTEEFSKDDLVVIVTILEIILHVRGEAKR